MRAVTRVVIRAVIGGVSGGVMIMGADYGVSSLGLIRRDDQGVA